MALRKMRTMCADGDKTLAEWDTETLSSQRRREIEIEFTAKMEQGFFAAAVAEGRNVLIRKFDPNADILLIPPVKGG